VEDVGDMEGKGKYNDGGDNSKGVQAMGRRKTK
jgi:hypothetical protein